MRFARRQFLATGVAGAGALLADHAVRGTEPLPTAEKASPEAAQNLAPAVAVTERSWPLARGGSLAQGVAQSPLPDQLEMLWQHKVEGGAFENTPAIAEGVVYLADMDGEVSALDLNSGKVRWKQKIDTGFIASPSVRGKLVYVGDYDGKFHALDSASGAVRWTHASDAEIDGGANFWRDNVLFGSQDANLYCLNAESGEFVWKFAIQDQIRCMPTVVGDRSFVAGCDSLLHIVDLTTGTEAASVPIGSPTGVTPAVLGNVVYFSTMGGTLFGIDWKEAKVVWKIEDKTSQQEVRSSPAVQEGILVVGSRDRRVQAHDPKTGDALWNFPTKQRIDCSPVIVGNRVFVGAVDGRLYALDLKTGKELWQYQAAGGFMGSPAVADGKLVITTDRGNVYCFGAKA
jgi:outer membrane protein assembly factor BamB